MASDFRQADSTTIDMPDDSAQLRRQAADEQIWRFIARTSRATTWTARAADAYCTAGANPSIAPAALLEVNTARSCLRAFDVTPIQQQVAVASRRPAYRRLGRTRLIVVACSAPRIATQARQSVAALKRSRQRLQGMPANETNIFRKRFKRETSRQVVFRS